MKSPFTYTSRLREGRRHELALAAAEELQERSQRQRRALAGNPAPKRRGDAHI